MRIDSPHSQQYNNFEELSLKSEQWKYIDGSNNYYISSLGRVVHKLKNNTLYLLEPWNDENKEYLRVSMRINGKKRNVYVHRLVA